jgi:hypothetical protein
VLRTGYSLMWDSMVSRSQYGQHQVRDVGLPQVSGFDTGTINATRQPIRPIETCSAAALAARPARGTHRRFFNDPRRKNGYSHQWHVELQRQFTRNLMLGAAYVGSYNGRMEYSGRAFAPKVPADRSDRPASHGRRARSAAAVAAHHERTAATPTTSGCRSTTRSSSRLQQRFSQGLSQRFLVHLLARRSTRAAAGSTPRTASAAGRGAELLGHRRRARPPATTSRTS